MPSPPGTSQEAGVRSRAQSISAPCPPGAPGAKQGGREDGGGVAFLGASSLAPVPAPTPHTDVPPAGVVLTSGSHAVPPTSEIMSRKHLGSLTGPPPLLQFPAGFSEASGMKSTLSTGPSTRCGSGSSTSWTRTSWTPAASPSRSSTSAASACAA